MNTLDDPPNCRADVIYEDYVFFECENLYVDGSISTGDYRRQMLFKWTVSSEPKSWKVAAYSTDYQKSPYFIVKRKDLIVSSIYLTLQIKNAFGSTSEKTVIIQSVVISKKMLIYYDRKIAKIILPHVDNYFDFFARRCNPESEVKILWKLLSVENNITQVDIDKLMNSQKRNGQLAIPSNTFYPYSFIELKAYISDNNSAILAETELSLNILPTLPSIVLSVANGTYPYSNQIKVYAKIDYELNPEDYFDIYWNCSYLQSFCDETSNRDFTLNIDSKYL